jgi:Bacteriocin class II with double-glycine leader peptide
VNGHTGTMRALNGAESAAVSGGYDNAEFAGSVVAGATIGAPVGAVALAGVGTLFGAVVGGFVGGFFGAAHYAAGELIDYCF